MKQLFILVLLIASIQSHAQNCIDTEHIRGYYVIKKIASELTPQLTRKGTTTTIKNNIDIHVDASFIPCDSITKKHTLSYWLNHFFDDTKQVFISCERFGIKYFVKKECLSELENKNDACNFPVLKSNVLYKTTNLNTDDIFEIYYLDAYWAKVKVKAGSLEADIIPSKIAQRSISANAKEFDLYCFVKGSNIEMYPKIKDPNIGVWKKKP